MMAGICPGCGTRRKPPKWAVAGFVALFVLVLIAAFAPKKEKKAPVQAASATPSALASQPQPLKEDFRTAIPVEVGAGRLLTEYTENEIGADAKYKGRVLRVEGIVERVTRGALNPYVVFRTASQSVRVQANFIDEAALVSLKAGQEVAMRCRGEGKVLAALMLAECMLEAPGPPGAPTSSSAAPPPR